MASSTRFGKAFFEELFLYSGQFAFFYALMQLIVSKGAFITNPAHLTLACALIVQTSLLARFGGNTAIRATLSFLTPLAYSAFEFGETGGGVLNAAHFGFWIYGLVSALLMTAGMKRGERTRRAAEVAMVLVNVFIFLFLYFYFDTWKELNYETELTVTVIGKYIGAFLGDPTHWFVLVGGFFLALTIAYGRYDVARLKDAIYGLFGKYVDAGVRDRIIETGMFEARKQDLCILFSDIVSFTHTCEENDAASVSGMLNVYFEYWNGIVKRHGGVIDKFIGDAIMVIFGLEDWAGARESAVACAFDALAESGRLAAELAGRGLPAPRGFGIGCHFGELIVGDIGCADRKNFTVIGDTVNVASRLESETRKLGRPLAVSREVVDGLGEKARLRFVSMGTLQLKGKERGVETWVIAR